MKRLLAGVFIIAAGLIILPQCMRDSNRPLVKHSAKEHTLSSAFNKLSRQQQIQECAKCHKSEYENELIGPHHSSYSMVQKHKAYIHNPKYESVFYAKYVDKAENESCLHCHAADNIYQTYYAAYLTNPDSLIDIWKQNKSKLPSQQAGDYTTGVDCMTCHYDGSSVVTNASFKSTTSSPSYCSPKGSKLFSSDYNCIACHITGMTADHSIYTNPTPPNTSCVSCHQEYDANGKGTHYYYWRYDPASKPKPATLTAFYPPYKAVLKPGKVVAYWQNTSMPHLMGEADEFVMEFKVVDKNNKVWGSKKVYFNCKDFHDKSMVQNFGGNVLPGVSGLNPGYKQAPTIVDIPLAKNAPLNQLSLKFNAFNKPQYWLNDSTGVLQGSTTLHIL